MLYMCHTYQHTTLIRYVVHLVLIMHYYYYQLTLYPSRKVVNSLILVKGVNFTWNLRWVEVVKYLLLVMAYPVVSAQGPGDPLVLYTSEPSPRDPGILPPTTPKIGHFRLILADFSLKWGVPSGSMGLPTKHRTVCPCLPNFSSLDPFFGILLA